MSTYYKSINKSMMSAILIAMTLFFTACSEDSGGTYPPPPTTITISGTVVADDTNLSIEGAQVTIVNAETRQNERDPVYTDGNGNYSFKVPIDGIYEVRVAAQGYFPSPPDGVIGIPITVTTTYDVRLEPITDGLTYGSLSIALVGYSNSDGALVIVTSKDTSENHSGVTSIDGNLIMYNLPVTDYNLTIRAIGHETYTSDNNVTIIADTQTDVDYISLTAIDGFTVSGTVTFLAVENAEVDVSLTDPGTGDVIPGTNVDTVSTNYSMGSVAPGDYIIRATYKLDGYVVDPDAIVKFGEPDVNVTNANVIEDIDVTGAVALISPIAQSNGTPVEIDTLTPTFVWEAYPSTKEFVVEVVNANGVVIWGGFADDLTKKVTTADTTIVYAGPALVDGEYYRWKVYASSDFEPINWVLISSSEEAQGVFKVVLP